MFPCGSSSQRDHPDAVSSQTMKQNGRRDALHSRGEKFLIAKTWFSVAALFVMSLAVCGCESGNLICNVSIGSTQSAISRGTPCMEPGLVTLPDGNLLAAFNCTMSIMTQMSKDSGSTWSSSIQVDTGGINPSEVSLSLLHDGKLFLSTNLLPASGNSMVVYMIGTIGTGDVITWSAPVSVSTPGSIYSCWAVSPVVYLGNGNLLWPVWCYNDLAGNLPGSSTVLLSTDGGVTWPKQITVGNAITDGREYDESAAVVYPNGDIVMIIRHTNPGPSDQYGSYWRSKSNDGGSTWSDPVEVVNNGYIGRPALGLLPSGGLVLLSRAEIAGIPTTAFGTSWDEGVSFSNFPGLGVDNVPGTMDVSDAMSLLPNGTLAVVTVHINDSDNTTDIDYRNLVDNCPSVLISLNMSCAACPKGVTMRC